MYKRFGPVVLLVLFSLTLAACVPVAPAPASQPAAAPAAPAAPVAAAAASKTLVVAIEGDVETLDPNFSRYPTANMVNLNVYDQFFQYGRDDTGKGYFVSNVQKIEGAAIEKWDIAADRRSVTLHVRQGVKFPKTGNEMTADDIIYWFDKGKPTNSGIIWNIETSNIKSWEKKAKYDVLVTFTSH